MSQHSESSSDPRHHTGRQGEDIAAHWLTTQGFTLLQRNYRCRQGEIDIIAREQDTLVFLEVRSLRNCDDPTKALASVRPRKQQRLIRAARHYLAYHAQDLDPHLRFDILGVAFDRQHNIRCHLLRAAFGA